MRPPDGLGPSRMEVQVTAALAQGIALGGSRKGVQEGIDALLVAEEARQKALLRPAAVAIHHDGHMARDRRVSWGR